MSNSKFVEIDVVANAQSGNRLFTYIDTTNSLQCGDVCMVPFGKRESIGIVIRVVKSVPSEIDKIKPISKHLEYIPPVPEYVIKTSAWLKEYYSTSSYSVWTTLLPSGLRAKPQKSYEQELSNKPEKLNTLNNAQAVAFASINNIDKQPVLLAGVTGSGKTEVYLAAIAEICKKNQSSILLVPEIMLTTQLAERLNKHFPNVLVVHSGLMVTERKRLWLYCSAQSAAGKPIVVIGARSAIWMPLHNLGLIIIDEEHESSYKQETFLRYSTVHVAAFIAKTKPTQLVLGSATPSVTTTFLSDMKKLNKVSLPKRHNSSMPQIEIVDKSSFSGSFSPQLETAITNALDNRTQTLLLLNRRGSASSLMCEECGHTSNCPQCDISLSFHGDVARLMCHYCGYSALPSPVCELCGSTMKFIGTGTQKLESEVAQKWTNAKIARLDRDNADWETMQKLYADLLSGEIDIVVGTQMLSRGLDIENLRLVGIIDADTSLAIPDYVSSERTFQLLSQTAGRAGRRTKMGTVIIQTRNPDHFAIAAAAEHSYEQFYLKELATRKRYAYPPYVYLLKLWYAHNNAELAETRAHELATSLREKGGLTVLGPAPTMQKRIHNKYVWQIIVKAKKRTALSMLVNELPSGWQAEFDPVTLL